MRNTEITMRSKTTSKHTINQSIMANSHPRNVTYCDRLYPSPLFVKYCNSHRRKNVTSSLRTKPNNRGGSLGDAASVTSRMRSKQPHVLRGY